MTIYLVRHTDYLNPKGIFPFHLPLFLSKKGRQDAVRIGEWLVNNGASKLMVYSSPIARCVQTAELIASQTKAMVRIDERLIEVACPNLQGKKKPGVKKWVLEQDDKSREPREKVIQRVMSIYKEKVRRGKDCVLVSHGEPLTFLYFRLIGKKIPKYPWSPGYRNVVVSKGEVVKIKITKGKLEKIKKISPLG